MNSNDFNNILGGALAAFLVLLLLNFASGKIYGTGEGGHHGPEQLAFALEIEDESGPKEDDVPIDLASLVGGADAAAGEKLFKKCKSCHEVEAGKNKSGPNLWGIVNRDIASVSDFTYSGALTEKEGDWTLDALSGFLENPKKWAPGTAMAFGGFKDPQDRVNIIVYLNNADGTPEALE